MFLQNVYKSFSSGYTEGAENPGYGNPVLT